MDSNRLESPGMPVVRRVRVTSGSQLPRDYSQTPGGTIFSTTPGGTRIVYDRDFLLSRRDSPLARTPPAALARIPGVTCPAEAEEEDGKDTAATAAGATPPKEDGDAGGNHSNSNGHHATEFHLDDV